MNRLLILMFALFVTGLAVVSIAPLYAAGFDGSGNVTNQTSAAQTVKDANQALTDAHTVLVQAVSDLQKAVQAWKTSNP